MSSKAFGRIMRGLGEAKSYVEGERDGSQVTIRVPEMPARAYLTSIQRESSAVLKALHPVLAERPDTPMRRKA